MNPLLILGLIAGIFALKKRGGGTQEFGEGGTGPYGYGPPNPNGTNANNSGFYGPPAPPGTGGAPAPGTPSTFVRDSSGAYKRVALSDLSPEQVAEQRATQAYFSTGLEDTAHQLEKSVNDKGKKYDGFLTLLFQNGYAAAQHKTVQDLGFKLGVYDAATQAALTMVLQHPAPMVP